MHAIGQSIGGVGAFALYFAVSLLALGVFVALYVRVTPYREISLIREGNRAAAMSLGGAMIGYAIPLSKAVAQSSSIADMLIWAGAAFLAQVVGYAVAAVCIPRFKTEIAGNNVAGGLFLASLSIAIGILNAAAMTE